MATILFTWELGGGFGHLMLLSPIARAMLGAGHRVIFATKEVTSAQRVFGDVGVELLATPRSRQPIAYPKPVSFAQLLSNIGFGDTNYLLAHANVWRTIYELVRPELIVFNHSPIAMLAARGMATRKITIGSGFLSPPDVAPLPALRQGPSTDMGQIKLIEEELRARANQLLLQWNRPALERLGQLYSDVDETFLTTYPELEHFPSRGPAQYWGTINGGDSGGKEPIWPQGAGKKIYGYLKMFPALQQLLEAIKASGQPTVIYIDGLRDDLYRRFNSGTMRIERERLNIGSAVGQCDVAVTHGTLSTTAMLLGAGKPVLVVPLQLEQSILGRAVVEHRAGVVVSQDQPGNFALRLKTVLEDAGLKEGASKLAERFGKFDLAKNQEEIIRRIGALLSV